jgi:hypothetical protein
MKKQIKDMIKKKIKTHEFNIKIYEIIKHNIEPYKSKNINKKIFNKLLPTVEHEIKEKLGDIVSDIYIDSRLSWWQIRIDFNEKINTGYSYSFMLKYHNEGKEFSLDRFVELNTCWTAEYKRLEDTKNHLANDKFVSDLAKNAKKLLEAQEFFKDAFQYSNNIHFDHEFNREILGVKS